MIITPHSKSLVPSLPTFSSTPISPFVLNSDTDFTHISVVVRIILLIFVSYQSGCEKRSTSLKPHSSAWMHATQSPDGSGMDQKDYSKMDYL